MSAIFFDSIQCHFISTGLMPSRAVLMLQHVLDYLVDVSTPFLTKVRVMAPPYAGVIKISEDSSAGRSIRSILQQKAQTSDRFEEDTIWHVAYAVLKALAFLHMPAAKLKGVDGNYCFVHGHITSDTVFVTPDQEVKLGHLHDCTLILCGAGKKGSQRTHPFVPLDIDSTVFPPSITPGYELLVDTWALGKLLLQLANVPEESLASTFSADLVSLIKGFLTADDTARLSAVEALHHPRFAAIELEHASQALSSNYVPVGAPKTHNEKNQISGAGQHIPASNVATPAQITTAMPAEDRTPLTLVNRTYAQTINAPGSIAADSLSDLSELHLGVIMGDLYAVEKKLHLHGMRSANGMTALMFAAAYNRIDVLPLLRPKETGCMCLNKHTAYYYALAAGNLTIADTLYADEYLVEASANPTFCAFRACTDIRERIELAIAQQNLVELHYITMTESTIMDQQQSFMHTAVDLNNWQLVLILTRFEARKLNDRGETCLQRAARLGYTEIVKILAPYEANIGFHDPDTPGKIVFAIDLAAANGHAQCFDLLKFYEHREEYARKGLLFSSPQGNTPLIAAVLSRDYEIIRMRCQDNIACYDRDGYTALMHAVLTEQLEAVVLLLKGASQVCRNEQYKGLTSLWIAYKLKNSAIARILAPYEANKPHPSGATVFTATLRDGNLQMIVALESHSNYAFPTSEALMKATANLSWVNAMHLTPATCHGCSVETLLYMSLEDKTQTDTLRIPFSSSSETPSIPRSFSCSSTQSSDTVVRSFSSTSRNFKNLPISLIRKSLVMNTGSLVRSLSIDIVDKPPPEQKQTPASPKVVVLYPDNTYHLGAFDEGMHHDCKHHIKCMQALLNSPSHGSSLPTVESPATKPAGSSAEKELGHQTLHWFEDTLFAPSATLKIDDTTLIEAPSTPFCGLSTSTSTAHLQIDQDLTLPQLDPKLTDLMRSVIVGDIFGVIRYRHQICLQTSNGTTALMIAVVLNNLPMVSLLVGEKGILRNDGLCASNFVRADAIEIQAILANEHRYLRDANGRTSLMRHIMSSSADSGLSGISISRGIEDSVVCVSREPMGPVTALGFATFQGRQRIIKSLIDFNEFYSVFSDHHTPLMIAAIAGRLSVAKTVLTRFVGLQDQDGYTALAIAAACGHADIVELLLPYEAHLCTADGLTAAAIAARKNRTRCLEVMHREYIRYRSLDIYTCLFKPQDTTGMSVLIHAAAAESTEAFVWLLKNTEETNKCLPNGDTPLMYCCRNDLYEYAEMLVSHNKGVRATNARGETALMIAAAANNIDCVKLLLPREGGMKGARNTTALIAAVKSGACEAAELLVSEAGSQEDGDYTALYYAVGEYYNDRLINTLLPYEGDICPELLEAAIDQFCPRSFSRINAMLQQYSGGSSTKKGKLIVSGSISAT